VTSMHVLDLSGWLDGLGGLHPAVILLVIGVLALLESAAFVGLFVPGETAVLLGGALAQQGHVNVAAMVVVVAVGAAIGDSVSYEIGRHSGSWLAGSKLGRLLGEQRLEAAADYLRRRGAKAVFFGRFIAIVRTGVPLLAGVARMRYREFFFWNVAGAALWALTHVTIGYVAGASLHRFESVVNAVGTAALVLVVVAAFVAWRRGRTPTPIDQRTVSVESAAQEMVLAHIGSSPS